MSRTASPSVVSEFYSGKSVFITGATGFMGKVLLEKLLYSCEGIDRIYILIRRTSKLDEDARMKELLRSPVFTRVKEKDLAKIVPVVGDLSEPNLGISVQDEATLLEKVSVVFHLAATVRFNAPLREALLLNVEGTRKVLELCRKINNLQVLMHVSTAFSNFTRDEVLETVYPPPAPLHEVYRLLEKHELDEKEMEKLLCGHPNTYTFTKALAETLIKDLRGSMPVVIIRPSAVMPSKTEPLEGWVDSLQGSLGLLMACARGWVWAVLGRSTYVADFIPVDYVVNMTIVAAARHPSSNELAVYNCCTSAVNPVTWMQSVKLFIEEAATTGLNDMPRPIPCMTPSACLLALLTFLTQLVPAHLMDLVQLVRGQPRKYVRLQSRLIMLRSATARFTDRSWRMRSERAQALAGALPPADARRFPCHPAALAWREYLPACFRGAIRYQNTRKKE